MSQLLRMRPNRERGGPSPTSAGTLPLDAEGHGTVPLRQRRLGGDSQRKVSGP
ncbi:hypothetical protein [Deinococcus radiophilus]|uniref:hypothetical protein n=1 Tax=Deinococcus radiophilus TaxID=32062 RepID=UPI001475F820|nr:hypothetical protein [Deinococcus radiophilus]